MEALCFGKRKVFLGCFFFFNQESKANEKQSRHYITLFHYGKQEAYESHKFPCKFILTWLVSMVLKLWSVWRTHLSVYAFVCADRRHAVQAQIYFYCGNVVGIHL